MSKPLSVQSFMKGELSKRFLTRMMLRKIFHRNWKDATQQHSELAHKILSDESKLTLFANDLFLEAEVRSGISELPEGATESQFLDAILKIFEWIKENPEFILLILQLFGAV